METNTNATTNIDTGVDVNAATGVDNTQATDDIVTMSKTDYEKAIQSEADKVRFKASKDIKALQSKLDALTPVEKSQSDIDLETRLAELEVREQATAAKEQMINLQASLSAKGLDKGLADYLKTDVDIETFGTLIDGIVNERTIASGYVPTGHQNNVGITANEWRKLPYSQQAELILKNPEYENMFKRK